RVAGVRVRAGVAGGACRGGAPAGLGAGALPRPDETGDSMPVRSRETLSATVVPDEVSTGETLIATAASELSDPDTSNDEATHTVEVIPATIDLGLSADYSPRWTWEASTRSPSTCTTTVRPRRP